MLSVSAISPVVFTAICSVFLFLTGICIYPHFRRVLLLCPRSAMCACDRCNSVVAGFAAIRRRSHSPKAPKLQGQSRRRWGRERVHLCCASFLLGVPGGGLLRREGGRGGVSIPSRILRSTHFCRWRCCVVLLLGAEGRSTGLTLERAGDKPRDVYTGFWCFCVASRQRPDAA